MATDKSGKSPSEKPTSQNGRHDNPYRAEEGEAKQRSFNWRAICLGSAKVLAVCLAIHVGLLVYRPFGLLGDEPTNTPRRIVEGIVVATNPAMYLAFVGVVIGGIGWLTKRLS